MNAGACPTAAACGNANNNVNPAAANQAGPADKSQSTDFSTVMDSTQAPPAADGKVAKDAKDAKPAEAKSTPAADKPQDKNPHSTAPAAAADPAHGNPLPPWLALLPPPAAAVGAGASQPVATAKTDGLPQAADAAKLPDAAAIAAGLTGGLDAIVSQTGGARASGKSAANAANPSAAGAEPAAAAVEANAAPGGAWTEAAPILVLAKIGDGSHGGAGDTAGQATQFLNTLNAMLSPANSPAPTLAAPQLASAHAAAEAQAQAGNAAANNAANAAPPGASIPLPVQHPQWGDALAARVVWQAGQSVQQAHLHLNPPELGPIEVKLSINDDKVNAQFVTHHIETRQAIQDAMPRLREMMSQSGMNLMNANVFQQGPGYHGGQTFDTPGFAAAAAEENGPVEALPRSVPLRVGLVDTYA
jgi:flagellar hook-length control protein FliK